ncbi:C4-dicarboxylate transport system large permease component [Gammaproteobacteria bacterium]|nr:C4-dicarboxylate transport system large permease component [Gammaproteobacteria bacterium]
MALIYLWIFFILLLVGLPMTYLMLTTPIISIFIDSWLNGTDPRGLTRVVSRLFAGTESFPLMALPFFILAGELMSAGGITTRIVKFAESLIGHYRGGLAHVTVSSSVMLAGGCGSPVADASALGTILIPGMTESGYQRRFAAGIVAASSLIVGIIPPSGLFIMYAFIMNVSVADMFAGGILPGLIIAAALMIMVFFTRKRYPAALKKATGKERIQAFRYAFLPLLTPVILIGGIVGGIIGVTEGAAAAAFYCLILGLFYTKEIKIKDLGTIFSKAALNSAVILVLVGAAVSFAAFLSQKGLPNVISGYVLGITDNPLLLFFLVNIMLLCVGLIMDAGPAILILGPILAPVMIAAGVDPVHFAVVMCINLLIGLITPPMGLVLFVVSSISKEPVESISIAMMPFFLVELAILFLLTYYPAIIMALPNAVNAGSISVFFQTFIAF